MTEDEEIEGEILQRIEIASHELQKHTELWSTLHDGEIIIDTEIIAAIVIRSFIEEEVGDGA
jgi:hypothetical protein